MFEKFLFRNFEPKDETAIYANTMLSQTMDAAPAESSSIAAIVKVNETYQGRLEIFSSVGTFTANASALTVEGVVDALDEKISNLISRWKNSRFSERTFNFWPFTSKLFSRGSEHQIS